MCIDLVMARTWLRSLNTTAKCGTLLLCNISPFRISHLPNPPPPPQYPQWRRAQNPGRCGTHEDFILVASQTPLQPESLLQLMRRPCFEFDTQIHVHGTTSAVADATCIQVSLRGDLCSMELEQGRTSDKLHMEIASLLLVGKKKGRAIIPGLAGTKCAVLRCVFVYVALCRDPDHAARATCVRCTLFPALYGCNPLLVAQVRRVLRQGCAHRQTTGKRVLEGACTPSPQHSLQNKWRVRCSLKRSCCAQTRHFAGTTRAPPLSHYYRLTIICILGHSNGQRTCPSEKRGGDGGRQETASVSQ